jgi:hypothetical protein
VVPRRQTHRFYEQELLTGHFPHKGFLRVQYLPNGDFFLIGARTFEDIQTTRRRDQEMWVLKADAREPPIPLGAQQRPRGRGLQHLSF